MPRKIVLSFIVLLFASAAVAQSSRHFTFNYKFVVTDVPAGARVRVWFPAAHSDPFQDIRIVSATGNLPLKRTRESKFGNEIYYAETSKARGAELHFSVVYDVVRREHLTLGIAHPHLEDVTLPGKERRLDLSPNRLVPITGLPAQIATRVTAGSSSTLAKAGAIYDYVFDNMRYEKTGTGWGRGDVLYACNAKKGNCTDFHSLFIAMARSQGIPARFEIGFALPPDKHSAEVPGYHCWAEFFDRQIGWVPVDVSEAWLDPAKKNYFFGAHDQNRIQFTVGRDLELNPPQQGQALNYFIYPYVEVGGQEYLKVSNEFSFADAGSNSASLH